MFIGKKRLLNAIHVLKKLTFWPVGCEVALGGAAKRYNFRLFFFQALCQYTHFFAGLKHRILLGHHVQDP